MDPNRRSPGFVRSTARSFMKKIGNVRRSVSRKSRSSDERELPSTGSQAESSRSSRSPLPLPLPLEDHHENYEGEKNDLETTPLIGGKPRYKRVAKKPEKKNRLKPNPGTFHHVPLPPIAFRETMTASNSDATTLSTNVSSPSIPASPNTRRLMAQEQPWPGADDSQPSTSDANWPTMFEQGTSAQIAMPSEKSAAVGDKSTEEAHQDDDDDEDGANDVQL